MGLGLGQHKGKPYQKKYGKAIPFRLNDIQSSFLDLNDDSLSVFLFRTGAADSLSCASCHVSLTIYATGALSCFSCFISSTAVKRKSQNHVIIVQSNFTKTRYLLSPKNIQKTRN